MQTKVIRIGEAVYELRRVYAGTGGVAALIREKLEADAAAIDVGRKDAV